MNDWDLVINKAVLAHNNTVNKYLKYSPFMCMFSNNAQLPVDNFIGLDACSTEKMDRNLLQKYAKINVSEAKVQYKEQHDKGSVINKYEIGDEVMMKRNFGDNPKLEFNWRRGLFIVHKKIGPANLAIKDQKRVIKVYHHNNLKPIGAQIAATKTAKYELKCMPQLVESVPIISQPPITKKPAILVSTLDTPSFNNNGVYQPSSYTTTS